MKEAIEGFANKERESMSWSRNTLSLIMNVGSTKTVRPFAQTIYERPEGVIVAFFKVGNIKILRLNHKS